MKRLLGGLALAALLSTLGLSNSAAAFEPPSDEPCTASDVQLMAHTVMEIGRLWGDPTAGPPQRTERAVHIVDDCQFRLFDNNDTSGQDTPEIPHVFSESDYVLGGIAQLWLDEDLSPEFDRQDAFADLNATVVHVFLGPASVADDDLPEVTLDTSGPRSGVSLYGPAIGKQWYLILRPGSLEPGEYKWRLEVQVPGYETDVFYGALIITPAN